MGWGFRLVVAVVLIGLLYLFARWAGRPAKSARSILGWSSALLGVALMVPTTTVLLFVFSTNISVAGLISGLIIGLILFLVLGPIGLAGGGLHAAIGLVKYLLIFGSTGFLSSLATAVGFRFAPVGAFGPLIWLSLILFGLLMLARLPKRHRRSDDRAVMLPNET